MAHKLKTRAGWNAYAQRKQTVEPVFGIIKMVMGFRQLLQPGLNKVTDEWKSAWLRRVKPTGCWRAPSSRRVASCAQKRIWA